jgi:hypothetical protein
MKPGLWLVLAFVLIVAIEAYLLNYQVLKNLSTDETVPQTGNVVRLDLPSYNKTLKILDNAKTFSPQTPVVGNPFR